SRPSSPAPCQFFRSRLAHHDCASAAKSLPAALPVQSHPATKFAANRLAPLFLPPSTHDRHFPPPPPACSEIRVRAAASSPPQSARAPQLPATHSLSSLFRRAPNS